MKLSATAIEKFEYGAILKGSQTVSAVTFPAYEFEYGAILKGSQTRLPLCFCLFTFEYGAILKGSQTEKPLVKRLFLFEYGAILKGSQTERRRPIGFYWFEYGAILKGSQTMLQAYALFHAFEYCAILKGSQTIGSGGCIIARKSEFFAFLRFRVEIFLVLVYIISGICTTIRIGRLLGSFTIQRRGKGSFLFGYSCLRASALQNAR